MLSPGSARVEIDRKTPKRGEKNLFNFYIHIIEITIYTRLICALLKFLFNTLVFK